ncbi:MAG TPA: methionine--tRNA ligase [Halococcus sp.]|nr:methionine--tRNA ligase [Halococcus sp.]
MSHEDFPTENPAVVTCGLPYANGDLHVGHLRGYVNADVLNRALKRLGQQSIYVCGSDMHGTPIAVNAEQEGVSPEEFALSYHEQYRETFPKFNVEFDNYGHTHDETNTELTRDIVRALDEEGHIYEKEIQVAWDAEADQPLPDRYVEGTCPYCGAHARGDECDEGCGRHLEPGEIKEPRSVVTGNPAEYRNRPHKFFRVSEFTEYLSDFLDRLEGTANAKNQPREWLESGLQDWCITRDLDWGIDYPGEEELVLYVWVDAPIEYISSTKQYAERVDSEEFNWEQVWKEGESEIIHIIGRDIIQHHTVFWPAMLRGVEYAEPRAVCATGFITIDGKGLSTSRNRAVWAHDYLDEGFHPDLLRYYLVTNGGFQQDVDFSWEKFADRVNGELVGTLGNFLYRSLLFAHRNYDGTPDAEVSEDVHNRIEAAISDFGEGINDYSVREVGQSAVKLAQFGNEYIQQHEPWNAEDPERAQVIRDCVQLAKAVAVLTEPVMPGKAEALWNQLGESGSIHEIRLDAAFVAPPENFEAPTELFARIEDERVEELNEQLEIQIETASEEAEESAEIDTETNLEALTEKRIGFDDFQNLDIRVGRVESAEGIEGADDLARLEVDVGVETRQIVAGIKQLHDLDSLPGTRVVVLANIEKAELFGVESDGMILAAGEDADLLTTHGESVPGTKIR